MPPRKSPQPAGQRPEKTIGPFEGGVGVAIWINTVQTERGQRRVRSVTISPRRYRDADSGEWRDSGSFRPSDLPALTFALSKAQEYIYENPLPGPSRETEEGRKDDDAHW